MNLSIAIPNSSLIDETNKVDKTRKISKIARACAIFNVREIYIYRDSAGNKTDSILLSTLLKYLATPQYFRKQMLPKMNEGILANNILINQEDKEQIKHLSLLTNKPILYLANIDESEIINEENSSNYELIKQHAKKNNSMAIKICGNLEYEISLLN